MWLWNSVFHAIGIRHLDPELARDSLTAVLDIQREGGFIAHCTAPCSSEVYERLGYPCMPILSDNMPDAFEKVLRQARDFMSSPQATGNMLLINSWNEWTEGTYLEPDTCQGSTTAKSVTLQSNRPKPCYSIGNFV